MKKILFALPLVLVLFAAPKLAAEEVTIKGKITCPKCDLKLQDKCATVVVAKEDGKDKLYYFDAASDKKYHGDICKKPSEGSVVGTVSKEGDKNMIKVTKVEYTK
jgi:hypothetical protein